MAIQYIKKTKEFKQKTVFLRLDFNEAVENGKLMDNFRLKSVLPTIHLLLEQNCRLVIASHMGRPEGKRVKKMSLEPAAKELARLLRRRFVVAEKDFPKAPAEAVVFYKGDISEHKHRELVKKATASRIVVLENLRFYQAEDDNGSLFAEQLASLADVYVNDAFAVSHRKAASIVGITKHLPSYGGLLLQKELVALTKVMDKPKSPFVLLMGGIKITDKAKTLMNLGRKADQILLGGGLVNLLLQSQGYEIGGSASENSPESKKVMDFIWRNFKSKLVMPKDVVVAKGLHKKPVTAVPAYQVKDSDIIYDIGPQTILQYAAYIKKAKTIVWNGPLGHFEVKPFHTATMALARVVGGRSGSQCFSVVGGGETVAAVHESGQASHIDHVSTGGGAMLEFLAGDKLPGIKALE